jgi:N-acetylneuraminic acid mutarotase
VGKRKAGIVLLLILALISFVFYIPLAIAAEDSWSTMSPMPTQRFIFGVAVINDKIYAIGGALATESGELTAANEAYDPVTNTWTMKESMPTPRYGCAVAAYENKIYVFGGGTSESYTNRTEVYDPETNTWITKAPVPTARNLLQANVVNGKIYLIGGYDNQHDGPKTHNEVYDPATDSWTTATAIPNGVVAYASAVVDNKIYVMGGFANLTQIYDPKTEEWSFGASMPVPISGAGVGAIIGPKAPNAIYVVGGEINVFLPQNLTQVYFPENDSWRLGTSMPSVRSRLCAAVVDNTLYAIGGTRAAIHIGLTDNEQYTPFGYETIPENNLTIFGFLSLGIILLTIKLVYNKKRKGNKIKSYLSQQFEYWIPRFHIRERL